MTKAVDGDIESYLRDISRFKLLTHDEEQDLAKRISKGDMDARNIMIRSNLRLVVNIAKSYMHSGLPLLDIIAEGNIGLMKAAERFRPDEGASFSTYSSWWIKQAIRRAINTKVRNIRVPAYMANIISKWRKVSNELAQGLERHATPDEIAEVMRIKLDKVAIIQQALGADSSSSFTKRGYSKQQGSSKESYTDVIEHIPQKDKEIAVDRLFNGEEEDKMSLLLKCLKPREEKVLQLRYAFGRREEYMTLQAIGKQMKLTRERVRQIEGQALRKILRVLGESA
ncbi:MAG: RNA polymerase sigma factor RpoD/SigA [Planctomycetes bacterium]|nr:RNA polymerase sigma factor RpoD/SigA [Planctomycetota bacterium]